MINKDNFPSQQEFENIIKAMSSVCKNEPDLQKQKKLQRLIKRIHKISQELFPLLNNPLN